MPSAQPVCAVGSRGVDTEAAWPACPRGLDAASRSGPPGAAAAALPLASLLLGPQGVWGFGSPARGPGRARGVQGGPFSHPFIVKIEKHKSSGYRGQPEGDSRDLGEPEERRQDRTQRRRKGRGTQETQRTCFPEARRQVGTSHRRPPETPTGVWVAPWQD